MQAAALEGMLQAMCTIYMENVKTTAVYQRKRFLEKRNRAFEFTLHELINIASELSWFPAKKIRYAGKITNLPNLAQCA